MAEQDLLRAVQAFANSECLCTLTVEKGSLKILLKPLSAADEAAGAPDIPDAPDVPDLPPHDPETGEIKRSDAEIITALDDAYATAATAAQLDEHIQANAAEVAERGLEQAAADLADKHRRRINRLAAQKTPEEVRMESTYVSISTALRRAETMADLVAAWKTAQGDMRRFPADWNAALTADKDARKVQLQEGR